MEKKQELLKLCIIILLRNYLIKFNAAPKVPILINY